MYIRIMMQEMRVIAMRLNFQGIPLAEQIAWTTPMICMLYGML